MSLVARSRRKPRPATRRLGLEPLENRSLLAIDLISAALPGPDSNGPSTASTPPSVSVDGRYVGFVSSATNLVVGDTNRLQDVFVRDMTSNATRIVSKTVLGNPANGASDEISITPDGRYAVFSSLATNLTAEASDGVFVRDMNTDTLVFIAPGYAPAISASGRFVTFMGYDGTIAGDNNGSDDAFVWDRTTDAITLMSATAAGGQTPAFTVTGNPTISADGAYVAFNSDAANLVSGDTNSAQDIFLKNVATGAITRVSVGAFGGQGNGDSILPSLSSDGQIIAFRSTASSFIANDTNSPDIFVKTLQTAAIVQASLTTQGNPSNGTYFSEPVLSADGLLVAFESNATNLVPNDTNNVDDAFVKNLQFGTVTRTSVDAGNVQANGASSNPTTSSAGRYAAFYSFATNLTTGDINGFSDVMWKDLQTGEVRLVSMNFDPAHGFSGNNNSFGPGAMTTDGRFVAFTSAATDLVANDANGSESDIFIRDTLTGTTTLVSRDTNGVQGNFDSYWPSLSGDGRYLTFTSTATNLVAGDNNNAADIFRKDLSTGAVSLVTVTALGLRSNADSDQSMVSDNGRYIVFFSFANNLVSGDSNNLGDVFQKDMQTGDIVRVSTDASGFQANGESDVPSLSADGRYVAFQSFASNLVANDTNSFADVFVKDVQLGTVTLVSVTTAGVQGNGNSLVPRITSNALFVAFQSVASTLVAGDTNNVTDVFVKNLTTGAIVRASVNAAGTQGNFASTAPSASNDGRYVGFLSAATNLVTGDTNGWVDVFRKDLQTGTVARLSVSDSGLQADGPSDRALISRDGSLMTFASLAENLTSYDGQGFRDVFRAGATSAVSGLTLQLSATNVNENVGTVTGTVTRTGSVTSALVVALSSSNTGVATVPATVTIAANQTQATFTITIVGPSSTVISATAAGLGTATQTLSVTGVNSAPTFSLIGDPPTVAINAGLQTVNNFAFNISPGPPDEAGQTVTFSVQVVSTTGNLTFTTQPVIDAVTGTLTYAATAGTSGSAVVSVILFDNGGTANGGDNTSNPQSFTIRVNPGNPAAPTVSGVPGNQVLRVNENTGFLPFTVGDDATPPGNLVVTATSSLPGLIPNGNIQLGGSGANRTIFITPTANQTGGPATITVSVRDTDFNVTSFQFTVTVIPFLIGDIFPDGVIDPQDVGFIVYYFAQYGPGSMSRLPPGPPQRADVNLDGLLDAQDVLLVIDLYRQANGGEGEGEAVAAKTTSAEASVVQADGEHDLALLQLLAMEADRKKK